MEGMRDAALADYENLPDEEKAKILNDFKQIIANGNSTVSDYIQFFQDFEAETVDKLLQNCEGYEEGRLDFNDFITVKYVLEKHPLVICDGCSSLILGRPFFSCYECYFDFPVDTYDLCSGCYGSKKFEDHDHKQFYDNQSLEPLCRRMVAEKKEDLKKRKNDITRAVIMFALKFSAFGRSITTDGLENYFDSKETEGKEEEENSAMARLLLKPPRVRPRIDLLGAIPTNPYAD